MIMFFTRIFLLLLIFISTDTVSQPLVYEEKKTEPVITQEFVDKVTKRLKKLSPELHITHMRPTPVPGLYEAKAGNQQFFVSEDGAHLITGDIFEIGDTHLVNLRDKERQKAEKAFQPQRAKLLSQIKKEDMVIYSPEKKAENFVYIFTDIDCPYCRQLHSQIQGFLEKGIEIRYLAFPRAGAHSNSAKKLETVWCSSNRTDVMTAFKHSGRVPISTCGSPKIAEQLSLGQRIGVRGTPAIVLPTGKMIPGVVSPERLEDELNSSKI